MPTEIDEFADAFAALSTGKEAPPAAVADTPPAEDPPKETPSAETPPAAAADTPPVEDPPKETPSEETPPAEDPMATVLAEMATLREQLAAVQAEKAAASKEVPETPPAPTPVYTEAEADVVKKYQTDWPDVAAGEALLRRAEYQQLVAYVFDQVKKTYDPLLEFASTSSSESQYAKLVAMVPDYDEVRDKALAWVDTQPAYLKEAYTKVANEGSAKDVADLINRFKKETGHVSTVPAAAAATPPAKPAAAALPEGAKNAAASLKVVKSTRTEQTQGVDPNDFDSAFAEFASAK